MLDSFSGNIDEKSLQLSRVYKDGPRDGSPTITPSESNIPVAYYSDIKICYATSPGYTALRDPDTGSWYIECLCKVFADHAHDKHLEELLKLVGSMVSNRTTILGPMQTAGNEDRGFTKTLYFNPGMSITKSKR